MRGAAGLFITIDGPDGTGKTTVARALAARLGAALTAEPTDTPLGRRIRDLLKSGASAAEMTELFVRDRAAHVETFLLPRILNGDAVVCDRYRYSTVCYQHLQGEPLEGLVEKNAPFPAPDLAVILTARNAAVLLERIAARGGDRDFFETEKRQEKLIALYSKLPQLYPTDRFLFLDAEQPVETSVAAVLAAISRREA